MSLFIETIKVADGQAKNICFHQARFEHTRREIFRCNSHPLLEEKISPPYNASTGIFKCRVLYDRDKLKIEFHPHIKPEISSLKLLISDEIEYTFKSSDRSGLTELYRQKGDFDDILIIKNDRITDSYFANVVFWDGFQWLTPEKPLLQGCMRASLIKNGSIQTADIRVKDLSKFQSLRLINALNDLNESPDIPINALSW